MFHISSFIPSHPTSCCHGKANSIYYHLNHYNHHPLLLLQFPKPFSPPMLVNSILHPWMVQFHLSTWFSTVQAFLKFSPLPFRYPELLRIPNITRNREILLMIQILEKRTFQQGQDANLPAPEHKEHNSIHSAKREARRKCIFITGHCNLVCPFIMSALLMRPT